MSDTARGRLAGVVGESIDRLFFRAALRSRRPPASAARQVERYKLLDLSAEYYGQAAESGELFQAPIDCQFTERRVRTLAAGEVCDVRWPSGYRPLREHYRARVAAERENETCHARWFRHHAGRESAPVIVCIHGWGAGRFAVEERAYSAEWLYGLGLDVVLMTLPFHARRGRALSPPAFPSPDPFITNEAFAQAIHDLRTLVRALRSRGAPHVGVSGMSLGGCTTALLSTVEPGLDFAVPIIPVASIGDMMWRVGEGTPARTQAEALGLTRDRFVGAFAATCPLDRRGLVDRQRVLVIAGARDKVVPEDHPSLLCDHLSSRPLATFPGSHLLQHGRGRAFKAMVEHLRGLGVVSRETPPASR
jgi:pimeloyl-ACP methyl ester carboxylesterase